MNLENLHLLEVTDESIAIPENILIGYFDQDHDAYAVILELNNGQNFKISTDGVEVIDFETVDFVDAPEKIEIFETLKC